MLLGVLLVHILILPVLILTPLPILNPASYPNPASYRLAAPWIRMNTPKMRLFGGNLIQTSFSGPTTSRRPVDRPLISPNTLTAASNPSHARLEAILGVKQAVTTCNRAIKLV
jgi:hypothetical protein